MSRESLVTLMREASGQHANHKMIDSAISDEMQKLQQQKNDVITYICMPCQRVFEEVIRAWQNYLIGTEQSSSPGESNFVPYEWRSPITHSASLMNNDNVFGSVATPSSRVDYWSIEKWTIWEIPGGSSSYQPLDPEDHVHDTTSDKTFLLNTLGGYVLTDADLTTLGFNTNSLDRAKLVEYANQWNFGMEWLHAKPIEIDKNGNNISSTNPYAGSFRGYGLNELIDNAAESIGVMDTTTKFLEKTFIYHDTLLS